jgi:hypothetical protein
LSGHLNAVEEISAFGTTHDAHDLFTPDLVILIVVDITKRKHSARTFVIQSRAVKEESLSMDFEHF